jgi:SAM-dependent methyltransferase
MLRSVVKVLKKLPLDLGQYELRHRTKGKLIAYELARGAGKALDVGCRDGYWAEQLRQRGYFVVACDIAPQCRGAVQVDANRPLPFRDSQFDLVWCTEVIEHLLDPAFAVSEFKRVLRHGGLLILTTPNCGFWMFRIIEALGIQLARIENEEHHQFFTYADMRNLVGEGDLYGYFPYLLLKFRIRRGASLLSPTITLLHFNRKG